MVFHKNHFIEGFQKSNIDKKQMNCYWKNSISQALSKYYVFFLIFEIFGLTNFVKITLVKSSDDDSF